MAMENQQSSSRRRWSLSSQATIAIKPALAFIQLATAVVKLALAIVILLLGYPYAAGGCPDSCRHRSVRRQRPSSSSERLLPGL